MQVFADDGVRIDACVDGRGRKRAVVLIHGFPFTRALWERQTQALTETFCTIRPDLRGAGKSSAPGGPYLVERHAADVAAVLDALGLDRAALVGHSMGGYVALAFTRMFTERVARLALISSRLRADTSEEAVARRKLAERAESDDSIEPIVEAYLPRLFSPQTLAQRSSVVEQAYAMARENQATGAAATLRGAALRASSEDIAEDLELPMLMIAGAADRFVALDEARSIVARFPRGRLIVCETSGHLPMLEEPERVTAALRGFLSE